MKRWLYSLLYYVLLPGIFVRLWIRGKKAPNYRLRWKERLGMGLPQQQAGGIWIHAVSVGEVIAAADTIKSLLKQYPQRRITVTCMTPTGSERIQALFGDQVFHCYVPYDIPCAVKRFLGKVKPSLLVIMETELWPNLVNQCHRQGVQVILANARLSSKSFKGYSRFLSLVTPLLRQISLVAAQHETDGERFIALGLPREQLRIMGSVKFDLVVDDQVQSLAAQWRAQWQRAAVWIAASTHEGEDEQMMLAHRLLCQQFPDALLILVPRHPERFDAVYQQCLDAGFSTQRRSLGLDITDDTQIILGDSMGELLSYYAAADVAFVGNSLNGGGGHNMLEPMALSKPVLSGPAVFNFSVISQWLQEAGAMLVVESAQELAEKLTALFSDQQQVNNMGQAGLAVVNANRGARQKLLGMIDELLSAK